MPDNESKGHARKAYTQGEKTRSPFLNRARKAAALTIPSLLPKEGHNGASRLPVPNQSIGARGVNALSSKLLLTLFPPNVPFFQFKISDYLLRLLTQAEGKRAEIEELLNTVERAVQDEFTKKALHVTIAEALKQLIVTGSSLLYLTPERNIKYFKLDQFVVRRDPVGNLLEIIVKESISPLLLDKTFRDSILKKEDDQKYKEKSVDIYTHVERHAEKGWTVYQEVKGKVVPKSQGTYPEDKLPWVALRLNDINGEDYGRGYIEEYYGDLHSVDSLQKAIVQGASASSRLLVLISPTGETKVADIVKAENGDVVAGNAEDVSFLQVSKFADFRYAREVWADIVKQLSYVFLLNSTVQRTGERVTAEEIRYVATELEDIASGIYSILSQELQLPLIKTLLHQMTKAGVIPPIPEEVQPSITTGLEALGRGHDLQRLDTFLTGAMQTLGRDSIEKRLNVGDYMKRRGTALGIDMKGLIRSDEEVAEMEQAERQAQMNQVLQQTVASGSSDVIKEVVKGGAKPHGSQS